MPPLQVRWLGRVPYGEALALQERLVASRRRQETPDTLLLLEHPPVVTLGRGSHDENLLVSPGELTRNGVELFECGRGGDVTYHGPGQLIGYPIVALTGDERDAHRYLRRLEEALIESVSRYGIAAGRVKGLTGIWVGDEKLAAIGVRLNSGWITSHGFALNVATDLGGFSHIVPCGIADRGVTSLARLLGAAPSTLEVATEVARCTAHALDRQPVEISASPGPGPRTVAGATR